MANKISYKELQQKLADPEVNEKELEQYLIATKDGRGGGMAPVLQPNPDTVADVAQNDELTRGDLGLGFLNSIFRSRREKAFFKSIRKTRADGSRRPILLAEGDSWFEYPVWLNDTIDYLSDEKLTDAPYSILCLSAAGDELRGMVEEREFEDRLFELKDEHDIKVDGVLLSAGGNDLVGETFYDYLVDFTDGSDAQAHIDMGKFETLMKEIRTNYVDIITSINDSNPGIKIFIHGYDHANPLEDQGMKMPPRDGWLGDWLRKRRITSPDFQRQIVRIMIDRFYAELQAMIDSGAVKDTVLVDNRGLVGEDWYDELHPKDNGFKRVADKFRKELEKAGIRA